MIARSKNRRLGRPVGMGVSVFARVLLVIVIIGAVGREPLPARIWLSQVGNYGAIMGGDVLIDRLESGIISHHPFPRLRFHLHAHHFVNLYSHGSGGKIVIKLANGSLAETWLLKIVGTESGAEGGAAPSAFPDFEHLAALRLQ